MLKALVSKILSRQTVRSSESGADGSEVITVTTASQETESREETESGEEVTEATGQLTTNDTPVSSISDNIDELKCGFCLQRLECMDDPRCLPCDHVFCLPCLEGDFNTLNSVQCGYCSKTYGSLDLTCLPTVHPGEACDDYTAIGGTQRSPAELPCDVCVDNIGETEKYCESCDKHFCGEHLKVHDQWFKDEHILLDVGDVQEQGSRIVNERCKHHDTKKLTLACKKCNEIFCVHCSMDVGCGGVKGWGSFNSPFGDESKPQPHTVVPVEKLASEYCLMMVETMNALSDKISAIAKAEKQTWGKLASVENDVMDMNKRVDNFCEEQITEIRRRVEQLKSEVNVWSAESLRRVEEKAALNLEQIAVLEERRDSVRNQLAHRNPYVIIRNYYDICRTKEEANEQSIEVCDLDKYEIMGAKKIVPNLRLCTDTEAIEHRTARSLGRGRGRGRGRGGGAEGRDRNLQTEYNRYMKIS